MNDIALDKETGKIDIDTVMTGVSSSMRGKRILLMETLKQLSSQQTNGQVAEQDLINAVEGKISSYDYEDLIDKLKREGDVSEPRNGFLYPL